MISQFFILSPRGDTIILREYLKNTPKVGRTLPRGKLFMPFHAVLRSVAPIRTQYEHGAHAIEMRDMTLRVLC